MSLIQPIARKISGSRRLGTGQASTPIAAAKKKMQGYSAESRAWRRDFPTLQQRPRSPHPRFLPFLIHNLLSLPHQKPSPLAFIERPRVVRAFIFTTPRVYYLPELQILLYKTQSSTSDGRLRSCPKKTNLRHSEKCPDTTLIAVVQDTEVEVEVEAEAEADTADRTGIIILTPIILTPTGEFCP